MSYTGIVKWFDNKRGYGFISANNGKDIFVHRSQIKEKGPRKDLHEGENITFDSVEGKRGMQAINVQRLE